MSNFLFIIDPIETLHVETDTTLCIMRGAQKRGHNVWYCHINELMINEGMPMAQARIYGKNDPSKAIRLDEMNVIFMRKDPPVDQDYITATHLLSLVDKTKTRVINDPTALREYNEKLIIFRFPQYIVPTTVSANADELRNFIKTHKTAVIKPINEFGGRGVFILKEGDSNITPLIEMMTLHGKKSVIIQKYIPEVSEGDTRVLVLNGKILGAQKRLAVSGEHRSNISSGGNSSQGELTKLEQEMCSGIAAELKKMGITFAGIDVIGGYVTEINITSPTGLVKMNEHDHAHYEEDVITYLEELSA